ncbi:MAG: gliding motility-associated C-terminal domain-containing protein [Chitinophaga sp.]|uniref:T9SS type B sorting domain-containing protein n=1 Tax=Chitinophaga sp. TaxID=1869181 RepID=UPI0025C73FA4|nr:gliding motility-associated C-terminal domain-containing protein [Chitinophaga sp.]MBV8253465.1 gliding motility-associated C-terminal domain-containing protein [Chitinophaga sp.]
MQICKGTLTRIILIVILFVSSPLLSKAQLTAAIRPCGTDIMMDRWRSNPQFLSREQFVDKAILARQRAGFRATGTVTLPVVVHIINENPASITDAAVIKAIKDLNEAYSASGAFTGGRTNTGIQFCLAQTAPDGSITTGITRVKSYLTDFDNDLEGDKITALGRWDGNRYINIWVVTDIKSEFMQLFECGQWTRMKMGGYASAGGDIVVAGLGVGLVAHEMGHYLSLLHTFGNMDCKNDDCTVDGDKVCDTPPEKTITGGYSCATPQNSCSTDTLSGFSVDVPDLPDNFMDYGQGTGCILGFTQGQADRMHNFINAALPQMINSTVCNPPCIPTATASFSKNIDYPLQGNQITFTNTTTGTATFQWLVDDLPAATTKDFTLTVTDKRNYKITLLATNGGCTSISTDVVGVSCGVVARFTPDKRKIASKQGIELDKIVFTNRSRNATSYQWLMSNNQGMAEQVISTNVDLTYTFLDPGIYNIRLIATDGVCTDESETLHVTVDDPTPDAILYLTKAECYQQNQLRISLYAANMGYKTIPKGTTVAFYDKDPRQPGAKLLGNLYPLPADLPGKCSTPVFTTVANVQMGNLDSIYAVINDNGTTLPLALPNTNVVESNYNNNIAVKRHFRFTPVIDISDLTVQPLTTAVLKAEGKNGTIATATWAPVDDLSCSNCVSPTYTAPYRKDTVTTRQITAYSPLGCYDSAMATIHIPIADDYTVQVQHLTCASNNRLHVDFQLCNNFIAGNIPPGLIVRFYDADPAQPGAIQLGTDFITSTYSVNACDHYGHFIGTPASGKVFATVNTGGKIAYTIQSGLIEKDYTNNQYDTDYTPPVLQVMPADTQVYRKDRFDLRYNTTLDKPYQPTWSTANTYTISCTNCDNPIAAMKNSDDIRLQVTNNYGCTLYDTAHIAIFAPDFTIDLKEAHCYKEGEVVVAFNICMHNGYDSVMSKIPVTFYDDGTGKRLGTVFYTTVRQEGNCHVYTHTIPAPEKGHGILAVINSDGSTDANGNYNAILPETVRDNNTGDVAYIPFSLQLSPVTSNLLRPAQVPLRTQVEGDPATSWTWTPAEGLSCNNCPNPIATVRSSMKYKVTITNSYYCTASADATILTSTLPRTIMPTAFTPNGDGQNDIFYIIGSSDIRIVKSFTIFNRMGNKVFERFNIPANDKAFGWDGKVNNRTGNMDSYVYMALVEYVDGTTELIKGSFLLLR